MTTPEERLAELGLGPIVLPLFGTFEAAMAINDTLHTMGHWPLDGDTPITGKVGAELSVDQAKDAARLCALALIGTLANELPDLSSVVRIASVTVTINAVPEFAEHTGVADAASDLLVDVFGDAGRHARLAVGVSSLPANLAMELTAIVQIAT